MSVETPPKKRMFGRWLKMLLIVAGVVVVGFVLVFVGGAYWWHLNAPRVGPEIEVARLDGQAAANRGVDYQGCVNEASVSIKHLSGMTALLVGNSFLGGCLERATEPSGFCVVPSGVLGMRSWRQQRCEQVTPDAKDSCELLVGTVQSFCKKRHPN